MTAFIRESRLVNAHWAIFFVECSHCIASLYLCFIFDKIIAYNTRFKYWMRSSRQVGKAACSPSRLNMIGSYL